jgi:ADP-ribosyl-[dinitrogen reductase] hydrolase
MDRGDCMDSSLDRARGCLVGLAVGDAVGTTLEFRPRGSFKPLTDMVGGGHFCLQKGYWTDDTSMALCLSHSLLACQGFNATDQMQRYCDWYDNGYLSSIGNCFDIGTTVSGALRRFQKSGNPFSGMTAKWTSGNGSIMRLAPIPIAYRQDTALAVFFAKQSSSTTHRAELCLDACGLLAAQLVELLQGGDKESLLRVSYPAQTDAIATLQQFDFIDKNYRDLRGTGYVLESLEAALWCFWHTHCYADCILAAANLGDDADTTAAIAGQLAGAYYGYKGIREDWLQHLYWHDEICALADQLYDLRPTRDDLTPEWPNAATT